MVGPYAANEWTKEDEKIEDGKYDFIPYHTILRHGWPELPPDQVYRRAPSEPPKRA